MQKRLGSDSAKRSVNLRFFGEVIGELKRVTWPSANETLRLTLMVLAVSVVIGVVLGVSDLIYGWAFGFILD